MRMQEGQAHLAFLEVARRARRAGDAAELAFVAVNDSSLLAPYRQAALWFATGGVRALSGVVRPERNAPYVLWLERVCAHLASTQAEAVAVDSGALPEALRDEWSEWLPAYAVWLPLAAAATPGEAGLLGQGGGLLLARETPWRPGELSLLAEWADLWRHAWLARCESEPWSPARAWQLVRSHFAPTPGAVWWRQRWLRWALVAAGVLLCPVRLSVLAPGELVPANPAVIRAPLDGTLGAFFVRPNATVKAGEALFEFDKAPLAARYEVASQGLATALAEYRQSAQLALSDAKSKAQLAIVQGKIDERKAEVEAWLPVGDAIPLADGAAVSLFLNASPFNAVTAKLRYVAHDAVQRPDGTYAYRVRAVLASSTEHRVGLKGTARLSGRWVPLVYWVLRRPFAALRQTIGL